MGALLNNETPVMHVQLRDKSGKIIHGGNSLYLRGLTYQYYHDRQWQRIAPSIGYTDPVRPRNLPYRIDLLTDQHLQDVPWVEQKITMEPIGTQTLFALSGLLELRCPGLVRIEKNTLDETYRSSVPLRQVTRYTVLSSASGRSQFAPAELFPDNRRLSGEKREAYLQVPSELGRRLNDLAARIAPPAERLTPLERARRVEQYLKNNFGYTLELDADPGVEPVEDFLFNRKKGHCEYFASSMVILSRILGVPSRLVSGFCGGEWNDVAEWYLIKQSDAHAWVEVYLDNEGWVRFDPTPGAARDALGPHAFVGKWARWLDYLRTSWINHVVEYDEEQQSAILEHTRNASRHFRQSMALLLARVGRVLKSALGILTDVRRLTTLEGLVIVLSVLAASTTVVLTMRWLLLKLARRLGEAIARARARRLGRAHVAFYQELQQVLKRRGFVRAPSTTPQEFAEQVASQMEGARKAIEELTGNFYAVRFGGRPLDADQERRLRSVIASIRSTPACRP